MVVPEVGNETLRTVAHLIGVQRQVPVFFLLYTIFPNPLRLYRDTMHAPIVPDDEIRALNDAERDEVESFIASFIARDTPIRPYRRTPFTFERARLLLRHLVVKALWDHDNQYLRPIHWLGGQVREHIQARTVRRLYEPLREGRPFVYFPLHVVDDYKIKRVLPHCADQASLVEQVARALPQGYDLVIKEHPMAIGRTPLSFLRRLRAARNVRLVAPDTSSHGLVSAAEAVVVIGSTVGLEALLYGKPVLTLGQPFYSGYGITLDIDSFSEIRETVPAVLRFTPDRERILCFLHAAMRQCRPGAPVLVDRSETNARALGRSLDAAGREEPGTRSGTLRLVPSGPTLFADPPEADRAVDASDPAGVSG